MIESTQHRLTERQERFAQAYVRTGNAAESARQAGYSEDTAKSIGQENLTKPDIQARIAELKQAQAEDPENVLTVEKVMRDLRQIAESGDSESVRVRAYELIAKHLQAFLPGRRVKVDLPKLDTMQAIAEATERITQAVSAGEITIEDAKGLADVIEIHRTALWSRDMERRLAAIEAAGVAQPGRPAEFNDADRQ